MLTLVEEYGLLLGLGALSFGLYTLGLLAYARSCARRSAGRDRLALPPPAWEREIAALREQVTRLQCEVDRMKAAPYSPTPYSQAIAMAKHGHGVAEIAASCGISRGEAELIVAMHKVSFT